MFILFSKLVNINKTAIILKVRNGTVHSMDQVLTNCSNTWSMGMNYSGMGDLRGTFLRQHGMTL